MRRLVAPFIAVLVVLAGVAWPSTAADFDATPHLLKDIAPGALNSETVRTGTNPDIDRRGVALGSKLIFGADTGTTYTLWVSDGTTHGTVPLATPVRTPSDFVVFANHVYFAADGPDGRELWKTDGTSAGTVEVANLNPASSGATDSDPSQLTVVGGSLYFVAKPAGSGQELYRLSAPPAIGPPAPPTKITSFGGSIGIQHLAAFGSKVVFSTDPGGTGFEPWISDGTAGAGHTFMLRDVYTGSTGSDPRYFTTVGSKVYFSAGSSASGVELWQSDGTSLGTTQVVDLIAGSTSGVPKDLYAYNGRLLFKQAAGTLALWTVDGSGVVHKLADLQGGGTDNNPTGWTYYGGYVYFSGSTPALGAELYRTRGVPGDVTLVKSIIPARPTAPRRSSRSSATSCSSTPRTPPTGPSCGAATAPPPARRSSRTSTQVCRAATPRCSGCSAAPCSSRPGTPRTVASRGSTRPGRPPRPATRRSPTRGPRPGPSTCT